MQVTNATPNTTTRTTRPRTSTRSGSVTPTYIVGPISANTATIRPGTVSAPETSSNEKATNA